MSGSGSNDKVRIQDGYTHSLEWFKIHADQRMKNFNFYIIFLGAFMALSGKILGDGGYIQEILLGLSLIALSYAFFSLDRRTSEIIKVAERSLDKIETTFAQELKIEEVRLVKGSDCKNGTISYTSSFTIIFTLGGVIGLVLFLHGLTQANSIKHVDKIEVSEKHDFH